MPCWQPHVANLFSNSFCFGFTVTTFTGCCAAGGGNTGSIAPHPIQPTSDGGPYSHLGDLGPVASSQLVGFESALLQLGNVLEASLRSCSVLIERFHHSLFLYVLTGLNAYVSVERYIGPLVALICVLALQVWWARGGEFWGREWGVLGGRGLKVGGGRSQHVSGSVHPSGLPAPPSSRDDDKCKNL
jgi:hypothetical protein